MSDIEILFGIPSPRDNIEQVLEHQRQIKSYDKYKALFYKETVAYDEIRKFFIENKKYTHLALACDDIVVMESHLDRLKQNLIENKYQIMAGVMNVEQDNLNFYAITPLDNIPSLNWTRRFYTWYDTMELSFEDNPIFQVGFCGFSLQIFDREFVEKYEFRGDAQWNGGGVKDDNGLFQEDGGSLDVVVSNYCHENKIPIFVDKRCKMIHLRRSGKIRVGTEPSRCEFIPKEQ